MKKLNYFKDFKDLKATFFGAIITALILSPYWLIMIFKLIQNG